MGGGKRSGGKWRPVLKCKGTCAGTTEIEERSEVSRRMAAVGGVGLAEGPRRIRTVEPRRPRVVGACFSHPSITTAVAAAVAAAVAVASQLDAPATSLVALAAGVGCGLWWRARLSAAVAIFAHDLDGKPELEVNACFDSAQCCLTERRERYIRTSVRQKLP